MPNYNQDQIERICQINFDLSQFNCDTSFLSKAFSIEPVDLQLETVRECDFNKSFMSFRKKRKRSKNLTKSGKKGAGKINNSERLSDNLLSNYLVKQETERLIPSNQLLMKSQMKSKRNANMDSTLISQRQLNKNFLKS